MSLKSVSKFVLCLLACVVLAACNFKPQFLNPGSGVSSAPRAKSSEAFEQLVAAARDNLYNERFAQLDTTASQLRAGKERLPGGSWKLKALYDGLDEPASDRPSEGEWQVHFDKLRKWTTQFPNSITARVGLASAMVAYAWNARGDGYAGTVSGEGWRLFAERSALADQMLNDAQKLSETCPHWYVAKLRIGLGQGWEFDQFEKIFKEGVALEPNYYYLHRVKAMYLLPRWFGEAGDWERFADQTYSQMGGKEGAILYYLVSSHIRTFYGVSFFEKNQISWARMREGFFALEETFGTTPERLNEACFLAALANDRETARALFDRIGDQPDLSVWKSKVTFDGYRAWAQQKSRV